VYNIPGCFESRPTLFWRGAQKLTRPVVVYTAELYSSSAYMQGLKCNFKVVGTVSLPPVKYVDPFQFCSSPAVILVMPLS